MRDPASMSVAVTGGGSGIGAATARHFGALGSTVTILDVRPEHVHAVATSIGSNCRPVIGSVTDPAVRRAFIQAATDRDGGGLDLLVNGAGNVYRGNIDDL